MTSANEPADHTPARTLLWHHAWFGASLKLGVLEASAASATRARFDEIALALPAADASITHQRACIAHIAAHKRYGGARLQPGSLKPLQIALVSLIEDARVEALAMRDRPGLRQLWAPYFHGIDLDSTLLPDLLRRLARALFHLGNRGDPAPPENHAWVLKGRHLFLQHGNAWRDAAISREIGGLLGNDLGQLRMQFNWKSYIVEPAYRDDNSGLWDLPVDEASSQTISLSTDGAGDSRAAQPLADTVRARAEEHGETIAGHEHDSTDVFTQPEWDYVIRRYRHDWVQVRERPCATGATHALDDFLLQHAGAIRRAGVQLRQRRARQLVRQRRQREGDDFDLDVCIENRIARARGDATDPHLYRAARPRRSEFELSLLIDSSCSTADITGDGRSFLQHVIEAAAWLGEMLTTTGDRFAIDAFHSAGRDDVRIYPIKHPDATWDDAIRSRLAGLEPALSTRLGSALRHVQHRHQTARTTPVVQHRKRLLFVLSDGEPADIDCFDTRYLSEDARRALHELTSAGTLVFFFALTPDAEAPLCAIGGRHRVLACPRVEQLGLQLQRLYARIAL